MNKSTIDWNNRWLRFINRGMFGLTLLGILDTIHLYVQNQYGFNKGCLGFVDTAIEQSFNCQQVVTSEASTLLGFSNTLIGLSFFLLFSVFLLFRISQYASFHARINRVGGIILLPAFLFSAYLVYYQYAIIGEYCLLCLISATLVTLLTVLETGRWVIIRKGKFETGNQKLTSGIQNETRFRFGFIIIVVIIAAADLLIASSQYQEQPMARDESSPTYKADSLLLKDVSHAALPSNDKRKCKIDNFNRKPSHNLISFYDPLLGSADPVVSMVIYFNPLRPESHEIYKASVQLLEKWRDQLEIAYKPIAPSKPALRAVKAIYIAEQNEKFKPFLQQILTLSGEKEQHEEVLSESAETIDMKREKWANLMASSDLHTQLYMEKEKAKAAKIDTLPAVFINGKHVAHASLTLNCLNMLLEESL